MAKLTSAEETLSAGRERANQKVANDQSFMSNLLKKDKEHVVLEMGWEGAIQFCSGCSGNSDELLDTREAAYQTAVGSQASEILLLKKLFVPLKEKI